MSYLSENILFIQWKGVLEAKSWREERRPSPREYLLRPIHFTQFKSFPFLPRFPFLFSFSPHLFFLNVFLRSTARRILLAARAKFFFHMLRGQNLCDRDPRAIGERPLGGQEWIERLAPGYFTNMWPENTSRTCVPFSFRSLSLFLFLVRFDIIPLSTARCPGAFTRVNFVHFVSRCWISRTVLVALCLSLSLSLSLPFPFFLCISDDFSAWFLSALPPPPPLPLFGSFCICFGRRGSSVAFDNFHAYFLPRFFVFQTFLTSAFNCTFFLHLNIFR